MNYYDILLAKKLEDDRDPKVEGLSVTANGTYSEEGKVYKPVVVNVAGYSLEDIPSGAIASFSDGAALPLNKLKVSIDPVQSGSGDPSPENIRPISGWTGAIIKKTSANLIGGALFANAVKNAMPSATIDDVEKTVSFTSNATLDNYIVVNDRTYGDYYIPFKENTSYTFVICGYNSKTTSKAANLRIYYTDGTNSTISFDSESTIKQTKIYTTPARKTINRLSKTNQDGTTILYYDECGIFEGTITAEEYEPYAGITHTIPFTDAQGQSVEVYGGNVDIINGREQPNPYNMIDLSTLNWSKSGTGNKFVATLSDAVRFPTSSSTSIANLICSNYKTVSGKDCYDATNDYAIGGAYYNNTNRLIVNDIDKYNTMTAEEFKTAMQGVQLRYELATPTTFNTNPTMIKPNEGVNIIIANTGEIIEGQYFKTL